MGDEGRGWETKVGGGDEGRNLGTRVGGGDEGRNLGTRIEAWRQAAHPSRCNLFLIISAHTVNKQLESVLKSGIDTDNNDHSDLH